MSVTCQQMNILPMLSVTQLHYVQLKLVTVFIYASVYLIKLWEMLSIHLFLPSYYKKQECRIALVKSYLQFSYQILLALTDKLGLHNNRIFLPPAIIFLGICVLLWEVSNHDLYGFLYKKQMCPKGQLHGCTPSRGSWNVWEQQCSPWRHEVVY